MFSGTHPRGFILGASNETIPTDFVAGPLLRRFYVDPLLEVAFAKDYESGKFVIVLGSCISLELSGERSASHLLAKFTQGRREFYEALDWLTGRYAILFGTAEDIEVVTDATAMRPVFYSTHGGLIASHASLIRDAGPSRGDSDLAFSSSFPANHTPYQDVRVLLPNFKLKVETGEIKRFWPREQLTPISTEAAAKQVLTLASDAFARLAHNRDSWLALTAGLDSRVSLAVAKNAGVNLKTFTYGKNSDTKVDRYIAKTLSDHLGIAHSEVATARPSLELSSMLDNAHYWNHHRIAVGPLQRVIGDQRAAIFGSNILEIGQSNYRKLQWRWGCEDPRNAEQMAMVYYRKLSRRVRQQIGTSGYAEYMRKVTEIFQEMIDETGGFQPEILDPFDEYYWMFRMGTWHGPSSLEKDFYGEPLNPFNSRAIISQLISVSKPDQYDTSVFLRLISMVDSSLLEIPINPKQVP